VVNQYDGYFGVQEKDRFERRLDQQSPENWSILVAASTLDRLK